MDGGDAARREVGTGGVGGLASLASWALASRLSKLTTLVLDTMESRRSGLNGGAAPDNVIESRRSEKQLEIDATESRRSTFRNGPKAEGSLRPSATASTGG